MAVFVVYLARDLPGMIRWYITSTASSSCVGMFYIESENAVYFNVAVVGPEYLLLLSFNTINTRTAGNEERDRCS